MAPCLRRGERQAGALPAVPTLRPARHGCVRAGQDLVSDGNCRTVQLPPHHQVVGALASGITYTTPGALPKIGSIVRR